MWQVLDSALLRHESVPAEFSGVQQGRRKRRTTNVLIAEVCFICFELKTGENRRRDDATLVKDCAVRGAVVGMGKGAVKVEVELNLMCVVELVGDPL